MTAASLTSASVMPRTARRCQIVRDAKIAMHQVSELSIPYTSNAIISHALYGNSTYMKQPVEDNDVDPALAGHVDRERLQRRNQLVYHAIDPQILDPPTCSCSASTTCEGLDIAIPEVDT